MSSPSVLAAQLDWKTQTYTTTTYVFYEMVQHTFQPDNYDKIFTFHVIMPALIF